MKLNNTDLLEILACPRCHGDLTLLSEGADDIGLACAQCHAVYPIEEGIPVMLISEAVPEENWNKGERKVK